MINTLKNRFKNIMYQELDDELEEEWYEENRERLIARFSDENPELFGTSQSLTEIEQRGDFQDWVSKIYKEE